jgi:hypothetical protein
MKFTSIILAAGLLAAPAFAMAQEPAPTPKNTGSPGMVSTPAPTNKTQLPGEIRAKPPRDNTMSKMKMKKSHHVAKRRSKHMTTGAAMRDTKKNVSPASGAAGAAQVK